VRVLYLAAPGRNLQSAPFAGILTEGTTVRVHGRGLGTAALAALLGAGQEPSASLQEVGDVAVIGTSGDTEQDWTDVRISSGEGRGLTFAYVIASQVASVALRFRAPTVIRATPLPNEVPGTSGGFGIDAFGTDFGVSGQVVVTVGGRPCPAPGVGAAFSATQFRCVPPQGAGSASPVVVTVAGQTGTTTLANATPTVTGVSRPPPPRTPSSPPRATAERLSPERRGRPDSQPHPLMQLRQGLLLLRAQPRGERLRRHVASALETAVQPMPQPPTLHRSNSRLMPLERCRSKNHRYQGLSTKPPPSRTPSASAFCSPSPEAARRAAQRLR